MHSDTETRLTSIAGKRDFKANVTQTSPAKNYMQKSKRQVNQRAAKKKLLVIGDRAFKFKHCKKKSCSSIVSFFHFSLAWILDCSFCNFLVFLKGEFADFFFSLILAFYTEQVQKPNRPR